MQTAMIRKSLPMKRSSSMDVSAVKRASSSVGVTRNLQNIDFPSSPAAAGEEIMHYSHSKHPLAKVTLPELFVCSGCKEYGAAKRFTCQQCDFQLHEFCAVARPVASGHPLHGQHQLVFHAKGKPAKVGISWPKCDVCNKSTKGFIYRCRACSFQMHPCCAMLSTTINLTIHPHPLRLLPAISTSSVASNGGAICGECNKKRSSRMYHCAECNYYLHVVCAKSHINGLQESGIPTPDKPSALGTAARLASQVVIEFIGGLIEGLGEGMGEALAQNITRGRGTSRGRIQE